VIESDHPVGQAVDLGRVVADHQCRGAESFVQGQDVVLEFAPHRRIQRREGLVEQQESGPAHQCPGQRHTLFLPAAERGGAAVGQLRQSGQREQFVGQFFVSFDEKQVAAYRHFAHDRRETSLCDGECDPQIHGSRRAFEGFGDVDSQHQ